jgi:hypothetical protein
MSGAPQRLIYTPRPDATPESELSALAAVYKFLLNRHTSRNVTDRRAEFQTRKEAPDEPLTR